MLHRFFVLCALFLTSVFQSWSNHHKLITPPDTGSTVIEQAKALVLIDKGKTLFFQGKTKDALEEFRAASNRDPYGWQPPFWISQSHYVLGNYGLALRYAKETVAKADDNLNKEVYELLGRTYHRMEKLDSAIMYYQIASEKLLGPRVKELKIPLLIQQCEFAKAEISSGKTNKKESIKSINTASPDYAPILTSGGKEVYFTARRNNTFGGGLNPDDQEYFEDIYRGVWNEETKSWDSISNALGRLNTAGFDAMSYVSSDGTKALMTVNTSAMENPNPVTESSDIFTVEKSNKNKWQTPKMISNESINSTYFDGAATMTADGNTMYFVTDRNGDKSSLDIWMVEKSGKNWGEAQPVPFNTTGRETTPYITPDGKHLFFSSDGLVGMGGYDIYVIEKKGSTWGEPINLGIMVNSVNNDTHFQYYPDLKKAVMTSYQIIGQKASLDTYEVDMTDFVIPVKK